MQIPDNSRCRKVDNFIPTTRRFNLEAIFQMKKSVSNVERCKIENAKFLCSQDIKFIST